MRRVALGLGVTFGLAVMVAPALAQRAPGQPAFEVPRTPWGHPDLQGVYTNNDESGTPLERPNDLDASNLEDVSQDELSELNAERRERAESVAPLLGGLPLGSNPVHWFENREAENSRAWLIVEPVDGRIPELTAEARERPARPRGSSFGGGPFNGPEDLSLYDRCITRGLPGSMMPAIYGNAYRIVQSPTHVAIQYEMVHEARVIPLDGRPHLDGEIRQFMGDGRARFEGDTLVIETTNFDPKSVYRDGNADALRLIERFTPVGPERLEWSVTVDDPTTWTAPWTFAMFLTRGGVDVQPFEYACHEGNYGVPNLLSGARAAEQDGR